MHAIDTLMKLLNTQQFTPCNLLNLFRDKLESFVDASTLNWLNTWVGQVAQLVEQWTENPRVGSSILPLANDTHQIAQSFTTLSQISQT